MMTIKTLSLATALLTLLQTTIQAQSTASRISDKLNQAILSAGQGHIVQMDAMPMADLPQLNYQQKAGGPPYLFTDDPEYIRVPEAAVLREKINPGPTRLYVYHCNGTTGTISRISAVIENISSKPLHLRFLKYAFPGVSGDYGKLGKEGIRDFILSKPGSKLRTIAPGAAEPLDEAMEASTVKFDQLIHGFYEFETDQPAKITVLQTTPDTPSPVAAARIKELIPPRSKSGAGRGYYPYSDYEITNAPGEVFDTADGPRQIMIADGKQDRWMTGLDSSSTMPCILKGNYGAFYNIKLNRTSSDGRGLALLTWNARYNSGCKAMGGCNAVGPGKFPAGPVMIPSNAPVIRGGDSAVLLQVYPPLPKGKTETIEITYTPPGASCLPTPLLLVPVEMISNMKR